MTGAMTWTGLDVHARSTHAPATDTMTGELVRKKFGPGVDEPVGWFQPHNKGLHYPADPPTVEEIIAVMDAAGDDAGAVRLRGLIVVLWCAGLRVIEALALIESELRSRRDPVPSRQGRQTSRGWHGSRLAPT
jgi:hypothetical protein